MPSTVKKAQPPIARLAAIGQLAVKYLGNDRFEWQTLAMFLSVADRSSDTPMQDLESIHGFTQAAVSRNTAKLGNGLTMNDAGARLIEAFEDPAYRRRKLIRMTVRGREFKEQLVTLLN